MNDRIKQVRLALGLSQEEFGNRLGVGRGAITNIELNKVSPKPYFVDLICRQFGVDEEWLKTGEGDMFLELSKNAQLNQIFEEIQLSDDELIKSIVRTYWGLSDADKAVIRRVVQELADKLKTGQGDGPGR